MENWLEKQRVEPVLALIKREGVQGLGFWDGCACCHFSVRGVKVEVGCGKGSQRAVWVSSRSCDFADGDPALRPIAEEVARQVEDADGRGKMAIYLTPFSMGRAA